MRITTLGAGNIGGNLGVLWARAGHDVTFSSRHPDELADLVAQAGGSARAMDPDSALADAEVVLDALPLAASMQIDPGQVAGTVLITAANHYPGRDGQIDFGGLTQAGAIADRLPDTRVVKAFNMMPAAVIAQHVEDGEGSGIAVFVAGDDDDAVAITEQLVRDAGFSPVVTGDLASGARFEPGTRPYGAQVAPAEARSLLETT